MLAILNPLNAHNLPIFQPILMILVSKLFMVHRALSGKLYLSLGLLSQLTKPILKYTLNKYHVHWLFSFKHLKLFIYLRNKETQQSFLFIVNIIFMTAISPNLIS